MSEPTGGTSVGRWLKVDRSPRTERFSWDSSDCMLYALSVGASADALDGLQFTTENTEGLPQQVLPTAAVVFGPLVGGLALEALGPLEPSRALHAQQFLRMHKVLPISGTVECHSRVRDVFDKGSGALIVLASECYEASTGERLFDLDSSVFVRGEGAFGGPRGPSQQTATPPERVPDVEARYETVPNQALLYRLNGDRQRLHSDPLLARRGGFDRPILHGLCTYGIAGRLLLESLCDADPSRFASMSARFTAPVFPGELLTVRGWVADEGQAQFLVMGADGRVVLGDGDFRFAS